METLNMSTAISGMSICHEAQLFSEILCMLLYVFLASITLAIICGNALVIISIIYFKQLHTPTNYLILSLAVSDLLVGILICPFNMAFSVTSCFYNTSVLCKIRGSFDLTLSTSSILNLCCISIDRYYAVCHPLMYKTKISYHVAAAMSLGSWAVSLLAGVFLVFVILSQDYCDETCFLLLIFLAILTFYLPAVILVAIYLKIFLVAKQQAQNILTTGHKKQKSGAAASKKERKATKTLALVMGVFLFCWTPIFLCYAFQPLSDGTVVFFEPLNWLGLSNSMFNPLIYGYFYSWFRSAFRMIISGKIFQSNLSNSKLN